MAKSGSKQKNRRQPHEWLWEKLDGYLAEKRLKQTKQRRLIVEYFLGQSSHVSAEDLHRAVRKDGLNIGLATIYRTLNLLAEAGIVEQQSFKPGTSVYELNVPNTHHDHLVCLSCGEVLEFENQEIERLQEKVAKTYEFSLTSHRLDLYGYCRQCWEDKQ